MMRSPRATQPGHHLHGSLLRFGDGRGHQLGPARRSGRTRRPPTAGIPSRRCCRPPRTCGLHLLAKGSSSPAAAIVLPEPGDAAPELYPVP